MSDKIKLSGVWLVVTMAVFACGSEPGTSVNDSDEGSDTFDDTDTAADTDLSSDSDTEETPPQCPAKPELPEIAGCYGVLLTDPASVEAQSEGISSTTGPAGAEAIRIDDEQSIDIKDEGCLQLGKDGADFSLSMWLKAEGDSQIIGTTSQYSRKQGFVLITRSRSDGDLELEIASAPQGGSMNSFKSAAFKAQQWVHVVLRYDNNGTGSKFSIDVNLDHQTGSAAPDIYNDKLRVGDEGYGSIDPFEISELRSWGRVLKDSEVKALFLDKMDATGLSKEELVSAVERLEGHLEKTSPLNGAELEAEVAHLVGNAALIDSDAAVMARVLDLAKTYESDYGPLFMTEATKGGIPREGQTGDALELERGIIAVQQAIIDDVYNVQNVAGCRELLDGKRFLTADYFPGPADAPEDPSKSYNVSVYATLPAFWGRPVAFAEDPVRRPTGLYLSPGSIGRVTVPDAMVDAGYSVLVGAHTADHSNKSTMKRLDRVSTTFPITNKTTYIANPLGGGVYIVVPYLADLGQVTVSISGVIEAPFFSLKSFDTTTEQEWKERRTAPGPWADFETEKFMMQVPSSWIYAFDDPATLLKKWDQAMDGVSELLGYPPEKRNRTVLYQQVDVQIRHGVYGIGYPQINNTYNPTNEENGDKQHWLLTDPTAFEVDYHELGHAQLFSKFRGETEALVNFPHVYVRNEKLSVDFDTAFRESFGPAYGNLGYTPDDAAIHWMVTDNFRGGREMDHSNTTKDEFRYQQRGYAKYADIYRIFGWDALRDFYHQENLDYMNDAPSDGLDEVDSRILRLSVAAGADLTPLIHFWGIHPVDPDGLKKKMTDLGIGPSQLVRAHIERYKTIAPKNNAEFNEHFERVYPGRPTGGNPDYGVGWYNVWRDVFAESHGSQIQAAIQAVLDLYYPGK